MADFVHVEHPTEADPLTDAMTQLELKGEEDPEPTPSILPSEVGFLDLHPFVRQVVLDKAFGCMIGSALGDTIGLYTEFLPKHQCELIYKERKFSLVEPLTELHSDSHRSKSMSFLRLTQLLN